MKTLEELARISRNEEKAESAGKITIAVGMATCGIAAGARPVMNSFANEIRTRGIKDVELKMTGCIGMCSLEPIAEVYEGEGKRTIYIQLTPEKAAEIIKEHIIGGKVVTKYTAEG